MATKDEVQIFSELTARKNSLAVRRERHMTRREQAQTTFREAVAAIEAAGYDPKTISSVLAEKRAEFASKAANATALFDELEEALSRVEG